MTWSVLVGDALATLRTLPAESVNCCITSPPYWGLRDYGVDGQIGLEPTLPEFLARLVAVFDEVRRALRPDGTLWLNMGDAYAGSWGAQSRCAEAKGTLTGGSMLAARQIRAHPKVMAGAGSLKRTPGLKQKDLMGLPWRMAFALQDAGWYLRSDIIWHKPNAVPESVKDRPTRSHEYIFLLSKSRRYHFDGKAIREPATCGNHHRNVIRPLPSHVPGKAPHTALWKTAGKEAGRNCRTVWTIATEAFRGAHFATFPRKLVEPCILAGCPRGGGSPRSVQRRRHHWRRGGAARPLLPRHRVEPGLRRDVAQTHRRGGSDRLPGTLGRHRMTTTESESQRMIVITPPPRVGVDWNDTRWQIIIDLDPEYADDDFDEPITLRDADGSWTVGLYPENAEEIGRALIRAAEIRRAAVAEKATERKDGGGE
jgi:DNA modification methylase